MKPRRMIATVMRWVGLMSVSVFVLSGLSAQDSAPHSTPTLPAWLPTDAASAERMARGILPHSLKDAPFATMTWTVNITTDSVDINPGDGACADVADDCSLRAAIMEANARAGFDIITLPAGTITFTIPNDPPGSYEDAAATGDLDITGADGVQISGHRDGTIIDAGRLDRIFHIVNSSAYIHHLTITYGLNSEGGGGIMSFGSLSLFNVTLIENIGGDGGAILSSGTVHIIESLVSNNLANDRGGGVKVETGSAFITNSTISDNEVREGGALYANAGTFTQLVNVTVTNNVTYVKGGIFNNGMIEMQASIVAGNTADFSPECFGTIVSKGYNLIGDNTDCGLSALDSDLVGTEESPIDPMLAPLADNGGFTHTHATLPGSPARDVVPVSASAYQDQRGVRRPQEGDYGGLVLGDIGAFEFALPFIPLSPQSGEGYPFHPISFKWTAKSGETKYRLEVKAPGTPFKFNKNVNAAKVCQGIVCTFTTSFLSIPNHKTVQWRVIANTAPKSTSPWIAFTTHIPGIPQIFEPDEGSYIADTTPTITWNDPGVADKYTLKLINVNNGKVIKKFNLTANSIPSRSTVCVDGLCTLSTDDFGITLAEGKQYALVIETRYRASNAAQTKFTTYKAKSAKRTFHVIADPGLIALPAAPDLRSSGR